MTFILWTLLIGTIAIALGWFLFEHDTHDGVLGFIGGLLILLAVAVVPILLGVYWDNTITARRINREYGTNYTAEDLFCHSIVIVTIYDEEKEKLLEFVDDGGVRK